MVGGRFSRGSFVARLLLRSAALRVALCFDESVGERLAAAALADEVDEVRVLLGREFGFLQLQRVWQVGSLVCDLFLDAQRT